VSCTGGGRRCAQLVPGGWIPNSLRLQPLSWVWMSAGKGGGRCGWVRGVCVWGVRVCVWGGGGVLCCCQALLTCLPALTSPLLPPA
jgi:hypothetical protein